MPKYSQNFLFNTAVRAKIVQECLRCPCDVIIEIGPGKGFLTKELLKICGRVIAVEIDPEMTALLKSAFPADNALTVIQGDFLKADLSALVPEGRTAHFAGNLPYSSASAMLDKILSWPGFSSAVLMFQKEAAERIISGSGCKQYGMLSLSAQARAEVSWVAAVKNSNFFPKPKVDSAVLAFRKREPKLFENSADELRFFKVARAAFSQRRKMAVNSMSSVLGLEKDCLRGALEAAGIASDVRAEGIPLEKFKMLSAELNTRHLV